MRIKRLKRMVIAVVLLLILSISAVYGEIDVSENIRAALVGDMATREVFYAYNEEEPVEMASVTKIMTYLVAREAIENGEVASDDLVTISPYAASIEGSSFNLRVGEEIPLEVLMNSIMIVSGNDAAVAIAEHVAGTEQAFVQRMHQKAAELGLTTAYFINPSGLPTDAEESDQNYMSAMDLFHLSAYLFETYPDIAEVTIQEEVTLTDRNFSREATNPLLGVLQGVDGLKTGYTHKAGLCLVSSMPYQDEEDNLKDRRVIAVLMGAHSHNDRVNKSIELLEYGYYEYFIEGIVQKDQPLGEIIIDNAVEAQVGVISGENFYQLVRNGDMLQEELVYIEGIKAPLAKGEVVGQLNVYLNDQLIQSVPVLVSEDVEKANLFVRLFRFLSGLLGI